MVLTGLTWGFPDVMSPLVFWCCGEMPAPMFDAESLTSIPPNELQARPLSLAELASLARSRLPDSRLVSVWVDERPLVSPERRSNMERCQLQTATDRKSFSTSTVAKFSRSTTRIRCHRQVSFSKSGRTRCITARSEGSSPKCFISWRLSQSLVSTSPALWSGGRSTERKVGEINRAAFDTVLSPPWGKPLNQFV